MKGRPSARIAGQQAGPSVTGRGRKQEGTDDGLLGRAAEMRAAFDRQFTEPPHTVQDRLDDLLMIRTGDTIHAVRVSEVSAIVVDRPITPLPVRCPQLVGLVGHGGTVIVVYDLAVLLGHGTSAKPRWLMLTPEPTVIAFAFHGVADRVRLPEHELDPDGDGRVVVSFDGETCPVLSVPALVETVAEFGRRAPREER